MKKLQNLDIPEIREIILQIESLLLVNDDQTKNKIAKLTSQLSKEQQQEFLNDHLHLLYFDADPELVESIDLIELFSLNELKGE